MEKILVEKIEMLRQQMVEEAISQGYLTNYKVISLSQQLDKHIFIYQKLKLRSKTVRKQMRVVSRSAIYSLFFASLFIDSFYGTITDLWKNQTVLL